MASMIGTQSMTAAPATAETASSPQAATRSSADVVGDALKPGDDFGPRYRIVGLIGQGGMGKVYLAFDKSLGRHIALKLLRPELASSPSSIGRFKQELLLARKISHTNVLRLHDFGEIGEMKFMSMAYVEGRNLGDVLDECGRLPIEHTMKIVRQLCASLGAAETEGVVHRDLKPRNVLIDSSDHVYVSDFGLARSFDSDATQMTDAGRVLGTPRYMAPEQVESKRTDNRTDIYALGLILCEMATGDIPFTGKSAFEMMYQRVKEEPKQPKSLNPELPDYFDRIILRCLQRSPAKRYQHARDLLDDLESGWKSYVAGTRPAISSRVGRIAASATAVVVLVGSCLLVPSIRHVVVPGFRLAKYREISTPAAPVGKFLAILPFRPIGDEASIQYTADGVVDTLSARLLLLKGVHLASPAAAARANPKDPPEQVARSLGAKLLVQGSLQMSGDRITIAVSLDDPSTGRQLWSKYYYGAKQDLHTMQDQIYGDLLSKLDLKLTNQELAKTTIHLTENLSAYELYLNGQSLIRNGQRDDKTLKEALGLFESATRKDPSFALAYTGIADAAVKLYNINKDGARAEQALVAATRAKALNDNLPEVHSILGSVYTVTGKNAEAAVELKRALELAPNSDEGYLRLGRVYLNMGQKAEALKALQQAVDANPYYWFNYNMLGAAYAHFGDNEQALKAFQHVRELQPNNVQGWTNVGTIAYRQGKLSDSIAAFKKVLELKPSAQAYTNLGGSYFFLGQYDDARTNFEKAVDMSPQRADLVANLADSYRWSGQRDKANATYKRAIALATLAYKTNSRDADVLATLASCYAKKGDLPMAFKLISRAHALAPNNSAVIYKEAVIHALAGHQPEALQGLREAFQKGYSRQEALFDIDLGGLRSYPEFQRLVAEFTPSQTTADGSK